MRRCLRLSTIVVGAGAALLTTTTLPAGASAAPATTSPPSAFSAAAHSVRLITGDTVTTRAVDGRTVASVVPLAGTPSGFASMQVGADHYVLPPVARYYGAVLDPRLFDVSTATTGAPLDVAYSGARPSVPGLTVTSSSAGALHGYVSASGARTFGTALRAQWQRDLRAGVTAPTQVFGAARIAPAVAPAVRPDYPQVTLVVNALDTDGSPLRSGTIGLINTDDGRRYTAIVSLVRGQARVSVPVGDYRLIGEDDHFDESNFSIHTAVKTIPDFTVTRNLQRVTVDFRDATAMPSISTPKPASLIQLAAEWVRTVPNSSLSFGFGAGPGDSLKIAPAPAPVHGQVDWVRTWSLAGPPPDGTSYRYDASYDDHGAIAADQSETVDQSQAAEVDANFYTDEPTTAVYGRAGFYPFDFFIFTTLLPQPAPLSQTQYVVGPTDVRWLDSYISHPTDDDPFQGDVEDSARDYPAGSQQRIDWLRGPLAPGADEPIDDTDPYFCSACRSDRQMYVGLDPIVDTTPGHVGGIDQVDPDSVVATFDLYRNGTLIDHQDNATGDLVKVPTAAGQYRMVVATDLGSVGYTKSTHAVTELTFPSAAGQGATLPDNWFCPLRAGCRVLPLMTATVPLPTDLTDTMPLGTSTFDITVDGARGSSAGPATTAAVSIAVSGGSYRTLPVTPLGNGRFRVTVTHPAGDAGQLVTLKLTGRDASGDAISQTTTDAYAVATS